MRDNDSLILESLYSSILLNESSDEKYLRLAENPEENKEELQRMVDEAAKAAGYGIGPMFHGSYSKNITTFRRDKQHAVGVGSMGFFTNDIERAKGWADNGKVYSVYLKTEQPLESDTELNEGLHRWARNPSHIEGIDAIITKKTDSGTFVAVVKDSEQIKLSDPVTYDKGNIIPLSKRFDSSSDDIRY